MNESINKLYTSRLRLQPVRASDLEALEELWSDPAVMQFLPGNQPRSREETQAELNFMLEHWASTGFGAWTISFKDRDELIGYCYLQYLHLEPGGVSAESLPDPNLVELAYGLARAYWGQGLVPEAARAALEFGFSEAGLEQIVAGIHTDNHASQRVLEKLGFQEDPTLNFYGDCPHFRLTAEAFREAQP